MPLTKRCCFCVNLRVGGMLIGVMTLALSVFSLIPAIFLMIYRVFVARVITHVVNKYYITGPGKLNDNNVGPNSPSNSVAFWGTASEIFENMDASELPPEDDDQVVTLAYAMLVLFVVSVPLLIILGICSALLIYGAAKGFRWLMLPWLICTLLYLLAYLVSSIMSVVLMRGSQESIFLLFWALVQIAIAIHLWICVLSLFQILGSTEWRDRQNWDMTTPRFAAKYNGVPTEER